MMAIDERQVGKAIRQVRELRGLTQGDLAKSVGLQTNSVALIERGERNVSMATLNALADALQLPAACFTVLGTSEIAGQPDSKKLVSSMQKLILATIAAQKIVQAEENAAKQIKRQHFVKNLSGGARLTHKQLTHAAVEKHLAAAKKATVHVKRRKKVEHA